MDISTNQERWIEATQHQAFTDIVAPIVETLTRSLYDQLVKVVGYDELIGGDEDETATENALNALVAEVLFESMTSKQLTELVNSHNTDR
jgi:hypothetical protein